MNCMKNGTKKSALRLVGSTAQTISGTAAAQVTAWSMDVLKQA